MTPHGQPLAAGNRVTVFLLPGKYVLPDSALVLNAAYLDLVGLGGVPATRLESEGNTVVQLADDVRLENLTLHCSSTLPALLTANDKAAYFPGDNLARTVLKNVVFTASNNGLGMRIGINYSGTYENCTCGPRGWGGPGNFSGTAANCQAGDASFGSGGLFTGAATNCTAGASSFGGGGGFHGAARNCTAGHNSFGGSGLMLGCQVAGAISATVPTTGRLTDCRIGPSPGNLPGIVIGAGASLYNCTVLANPAGTGYSVDANSPVHARIAHCRLNHSTRNVINDIAQPFNVDDPNTD